MKLDCELNFRSEKVQRTFVCTRHKGGRKGEHVFEKKVKKGKLVCSPGKSKGGTKRKAVKTPECPKCGSKKYVEVKWDDKSI